MAASKDGTPTPLERIREGVRRRWHRVARSVRASLGGYNYWRQVEFQRVRRWVFVCSGNICRSPYAEHLVAARGRSVISCGISARGGAPADPEAVSVALSRGRDLRSHVSRNIEDLALEEGDLLVLMDLGHLRNASSIAQRAGAQVTLLGLWDGDSEIGIHDPFGLSRAEFEACFDRIDRCIDCLLESVGPDRASHEDCVEGDCDSRHMPDAENDPK